MSWCLAAVGGILFILFIWLAILTIKFSDFKNNTEYKLEQMKKWYKLDQKYFKAFDDAVWAQFRNLDKKYKKRKVKKKK